MRTDIGRYLEGRLLDTVNLIKTVYDLATGQGPDVEAWVEGRELVFGRGEAKSNPGFARILPSDTSVSLSFPRGGTLFDPHKRLKGVPGSRLRVVIRSSSDLDPYVRRLIAAAYAAEG